MGQSNDTAGTAGNRSFSERSSIETNVASGHGFSQEVVEVLAARAASKSHHFSRSVGIVTVGTVSYLWWVWLLVYKPPPNPEAQRLFYSQVNHTIYMWPMVAFATATLLNIISWAFERRTTKKQLCFLAVYISSVAFLYEFLAWNQWAPIYVTATGRPSSILRYIMWMHATPAMLYAMGMLSDLSRKRVAYTIAMDIIMIVTALPGELVPGWHRWIWNFLSWAASPYVFYHLWIMYSAAIRESADDASRMSLRALRNCTLFFWCGFPVVWTIVQLGWVDLRTEEILWSCCDLCGKIVFSSTLLHGNFMTIEHRRYMAMRVVEEANRVRVIQELRDLLEQKEQFIALMSHELRTPLNGIIGLSNSLLTDGTGMDADVSKTVGTIHNSGCRLLNLINDILDAAALRKGKLVVQQCKVNLKNVTDDVLDLTQPLAKPGVSVGNRIPASLPPVVGDTARIVQILYNLIGNACKFTDKGDIWVDASVLGDMVAVRVHDTGIGIPEDKLEDIFCPFQQVDMSTTRRYGGTGLGLNLVKQLVEAHGGSIAVASKPGTGSTFTFMLRIWTEGSPAQAPGSAAASERSGRSQEEPLLERLTGLAAGLRLRRSSIDHPAYPSSGGSSRRGSFSSKRRHSICGPSPPPTIYEGTWLEAPPPSQVQLGGAGGAEAGGGDGGTGGAAEPAAAAAGAAPAASGAGSSARASAELAAEAEAEEPPQEPVHVDEMWQRLSVDCRSRTSYEAEASQYKKAPQQIDPTTAASIFASASAPPPRPPSSAPLPAHEKKQQQEQAAAAAAAQQQQQQAAAASPEAQQQQQPTAAPNGLRRAAPQEQGQQAQQAQQRHANEAGPNGAAPLVMLGSWLAAEERVREAERSGKIQVLSVDDDPVNQMVIQRMLSKAGFRVVKAANGDKALDLVADAVASGHPPDLVLLDVMMPGMSGYDVARHLRAQYPHLYLPIIMVSANKQEEHVVEGLQAGGNDYVTKPFGQKELIARIETQLRLKQFAEYSAAGQGSSVAAAAAAARGAAPGGDAPGDAAATCCADCHEADGPTPAAPLLPAPAAAGAAAPAGSRSPSRASPGAPASPAGQRSAQQLLAEEAEGWAGSGTLVLGGRASSSSGGSGPARPGNGLLRPSSPS